MRKFAEGGFSKAQEEFLGGADRTDPYILARMRSAVPDEPVSTKETIDDNDPYGATKKETSFDLDPYGAASKTPTIKKVKKTTVKETPKSKDIKKAVTDINEMPEKLRGPNYKVFDSVRLPSKPSVKPDLAKKMAERKRVSNASEMDYSNSVSMLKSGGKVSSASKRADGCAVRGKTRA